MCLSAPACELQRGLRSRRSQRKSGSPAQHVLKAVETAPVPKGFLFGQQSKNSLYAFDHLKFKSNGI